MPRINRPDKKIAAINAFFRAPVNAPVVAGALLGMGAVTLHDVPPHEVWAGNPARRLGGTTLSAGAAGLPLRSAAR